MRKRKTPWVASDWVVVAYGFFGSQLAAVVDERKTQRRLRVFKWIASRKCFATYPVWIQRADLLNHAPTDDKRLDAARRKWAAGQNICIRYGKPAAERGSNAKAN